MKKLPYETAEIILLPMQNEDIIRTSGIDLPDINLECEGAEI